MLTLDTITIRIAGRILFSGASASIARGQNVGLIGPNGAGKSTLLRALLGEMELESGRIDMPNRWRVGTVPQEAPSGPQSPLQVVLAADTERSALLAEEAASEDVARIADIHARLTDIEAHSAPSRAASILAGLGFDEAAQALPMDSYSGGWRMRVALAATLFSRPDLLLLDEPTNHLDLEAAVWLEGYLARCPETVIIVSHDRRLLNTSVERILHVEGGKLVAYAGGYDDFRKTRAERQAVLSAQRAKHDAQRQHMQAFIDRFRYKASKARQAQSRIKALEKLGTIEIPDDYRAVPFDFPAPNPLPPPLVRLEDTAVGYGERAVLRDLNLRLDPDDRIALLGRNGNGKSTFVKLLAGRLQAMAGNVHRPGKMRVGYFAQHQVDELDTRLVVLDEVARWMPAATPQARRDHLGRFGFSGDKVNTRVGSLSGGEKARLLFALLAREAPHLLLLDEPTNHLDIESREALAEALNAYRGAVIIISHDVSLIELTCEQLWLVADGTVRPYDGDLAAYEALLREEARPARAGAGKKAAPPQPTAPRKRSAEQRSQAAALREVVRKAEAAMAALEDKRAKLQRRLNDPGLYAGKGEDVARLQAAISRLTAELEKAENVWLEAQSKLETAA